MRRHDAGTETTLGPREQAIEAAFRYDRDRIRTHRNRLLGLWVAELFGLIGTAADAYAGDLVAVGVVRPDQEVARKVGDDLAAHGITLSAHRLDRKMDALGRLARRQILGQADPA